jgi:hypothetical protein
MNRIFRIAVALLVLASGTTFAVGSVEAQPDVVATTSWTAAFARAAGAENVHVLAPYELRHPPEHELAPSDVQIVGEASFIIFAGYERMVERLRDAVGEGPELIQITTNYELDTIREGLTTIASALGTTAVAQQQIAQIEAFYQEWRSELSDRELANSRVICHMFQAPLARQLGLEVVGTFGPAPLEAGQIRDLSETQVDFVIDNWHNDVGAPLAESMPETTFVTFLNFPGHEDTRSLMDVLVYNRQRLREAQLP